MKLLIRCGMKLLVVLKKVAKEVLNKPKGCKRQTKEIC